MRPGGRLFLTTPNACGYDALVNLLQQTNPNGRNQFYAAIESGHPHLWTAGECRCLLEAHGFEIEELASVNYYDMPLPQNVAAFLAANSIKPDWHGQVLRVVAQKRTACAGAVYPEALFPDGKPVQLTGALEKWIASRGRAG